MSYNGSGTFNINTAGQPVVTGTTITSTAFNLLTADLGTGLSTAICKDGQTTTTASIPFAVGIAVTTGITTPSTTFALVNTGATTVNFAGGATAAINVGGAGNTTTWTATSFVHTGTVTLSGTTAAILTANGQTTGASYFGTQNTSGNTLFGTNASATIITNGTAYSSFFGSNTTQPVEIIVNGQVVAKYAASGNPAFLTVGATTNANYFQFSNTSGNVIYGVDGSTPVISGGGAYEGFIGTNTTKSFNLLYNGGAVAATASNRFKILSAATFEIVAGGSTTISTGVGSVKMSSANPGTNAAWIPIAYAGTTYFVPAWTTNSP